MHSKTASRCRSGRIGRTFGWRKAALAASLSVLVAGAVAGPAVAATPPDASANFAFKTVDNSADLTHDSDVAVGFYTDGKGVNHGYSYNIATHHYKQVNVSGDTNVTATAINDLGDVAGFATNGAGSTEGFLKLASGKVVRLDVPGATTTQPLGVNDGDEVVGDYTVGTGSSATTTGFVWSPGFGFESVSDPHGVGSTTINGVNDRGTIAGFYTDSAGNTDGLVANPHES